MLCGGCLIASAELIGNRPAAWSIGALHDPDDARDAKSGSGSGLVFE
jgi:hypothetical protein